ncbi:hypothetical protein [Rhodoferax sp.]|uniref:hypothetical protein n=1 Tax=Rhodoferax sp. TaxID=50421 RepID=UPI002ACE55EF|nr:hypothetical protein [Rhodoferax sp.]MDZ7918787.1 hypothetical protein [Rhodoferax sp.]
MLFKLFTSLAVSLVLMSGAAMARQSVPVVNFENVAITSASGKTPSAEAITQAIKLASAAKGWTIVADAGSALSATLVVRDKHTISVQISTAGDKYSIRYKASVNMNAEERAGQMEIHPNYNKWVKDLNDAIRIEFLKL